MKAMSTDAEESGVEWRTIFYFNSNCCVKNERWESGSMTVRGRISSNATTPLPMFSGTVKAAVNHREEMYTHVVHVFYRYQNLHNSSRSVHKFMLHMSVLNLCGIATIQCNALALLFTQPEPDLAYMG